MWSKYSVFVTVVLSLGVGHAIDVKNVSDILANNLTWQCANNATCFKNVKEELLTGLKSGSGLDFGAFAVEPVEGAAPVKSTGRGLMSQIFNTNSLKVPMGPFAFLVQKAEDYDDYIEVALIKNSKFSGRTRHGGVGSGAGNRRRNRKYLQAFIPMFLAANTIGWMLLAMKAVAVLTVKAFFVSKIALLVAGTVVFKKLMETATEKIIASQHFEHPVADPILPYSMEYSLPSQHYQSPDLAGSDLFSVQLPGGNDHLASLGGGESMTAESSVNHMVASLNNASKGQILSSGPSGQKVKRNDDVISGYARKPMFYNPYVYKA